MKTYTFHVSLPGFGRVWRKVELAAEQTLEDLHLAIQDAYQFDDDHLYAFFMSGKAWDQSTEYGLPEAIPPFDSLFESDGEEEDEAWEDEVPDEALAAALGDESADQLRVALGDQPPPQSFEEMLSLVESSPELRAQVKKMMTEQLGIPSFMADMMVNNLSSLMSMLSQGMFGQLDDSEDEDFEDEPEPGDVQVTTLESLDLKVGKQFMYLFDFGDEWRFKVRVHAITADANSEAKYPRLVESVGEAPPQYPNWGDEEDQEEEAWEDAAEEDGDFGENAEME